MARHYQPIDWDTCDTKIVVAHENEEARLRRLIELCGLRYRDLSEFQCADIERQAARNIEAKHRAAFDQAVEDEAAAECFA